MILKMLNTFPDKIINENATYIFIPLTLMLSNDESVTCRKTVAVTLKTLLAKVSVGLQTEILEMVLTWLENERVSSNIYLLCKVCWNQVNKYLKLSIKKLQQRKWRFLKDFYGVLGTGINS